MCLRARKEPPGSSRLGSLLNTDTAELAQHVMSLTLQLEEKTAVCKAVEDRYRQSVELLKQQKAESDETDRRHQKFIDQVKSVVIVLNVFICRGIRDFYVPQNFSILLDNVPKSQLLINLYSVDIFVSQFVLVLKPTFSVAVNAVNCLNLVKHCLLFYS